MFRKVDGHYWAKTSTGEVGYTTLNELLVGEFIYGKVAIALLSISALLNVAVFVIDLLSK
jgi:hypothetical protein